MRRFVIAAALVVASWPASAQNLHYGMNTQLALHPVAVRMTDKLADLGAGMLRLPFGWDVIEGACKGCFDWTVTDRWRDEAKRTHRTIFASLGYTPRWANGGRHYSYPPDHDRDWYDFVFAIVSRYKDDIVLWGVWNEPNLDQYLHGADLAVYERLVTTATLAIRAANPAARVLGPEVSHHALTDGWYASAMKLVGDRFDIVTFHWYVDGPGLDHTLDDLVRPHARGRDVWLTEAGIPPCATIYGEAGQALFYHLVLSAFAQRRSWMTGLIFYDLYELPEAGCGPAIVRPDWSNRPAFSLLQAFIKAVP